MNTESPQKNVKKRKRSGRGALFIISAVFLLSAGIRLMSGTGAAIAREIAEFGKATNESELSSDVACVTDAETEVLFQHLKRREAKVLDSERSLAQKMKTFELASIEFKKNMTALQVAEEKLAATMTRASTASQDDLDKLTAVYESMKPKEAAALFEQMSPDFAAGFLGRMRPDVAASLLAGLQPETAYTISVILAGRNAKAPSE
jgi:flagellar motility protein MotE (MotC chaperone)